MSFSNSVRSLSFFPPFTCINRKLNYVLDLTCCLHVVVFSITDYCPLVLLTFSPTRWHNIHINYANNIFVAWWGYQLTKTVQNGGPQAILEILHIEYQIVCCIETYLIHIYHMSKCKTCNWNMYIERFCMWNVHFHLNIPKYRLCHLNELTFNGNPFSFIE